jgi:pimeloyl-ACP methyl ester carboxylesterase
MDGGAHLVGHSYGGCVCLAAAARRPEAVRSLTVIEPAMMAVAVDDPRVQSLLGQLAALYVEEDNAALADGFARVLRIPEAIHGGRTAANRKAMGAGLRALKIPAADELRANLAVVRAANIPLLVITGGWSGWFEAVGERVAELGGGRWVVTPSQDHFPQLNSGEFNGLLDRFMRSAESAAADPARTA